MRWVDVRAARRALAAELFHDPGGATDRAVAELYALIELDQPVVAPRTAAAPAITCRTEQARSR